MSTLYQKTGSLWYKECVKLSAKYPPGSIGNIFWWGSRMEFMHQKSIEKWAKAPEQALTDWLLYLEYKWDSLAKHREAGNVG